MKISREIYDFLSAWDSWAESGAENGSQFWRCVGLCENAKDFGIVDAYGKLQGIFEAQNLDKHYPFDGDAAAHFQAAREHSTHRNPRRRQWVKMMLASAEIEEN